jgi:hypothetical protein
MYHLHSWPATVDTVINLANGRSSWHITWLHALDEFKRRSNNLTLKNLVFSLCPDHITRWTECCWIAVSFCPLFPPSILSSTLFLSNYDDSSPKALGSAVWRTPSGVTQVETRFSDTLSSFSQVRPAFLSPIYWLSFPLQCYSIQCIPYVFRSSFFFFSHEESLAWERAWLICCGGTRKGSKDAFAFARWVNFCAVSPLYPVHNSAMNVFTLLERLRGRDMFGSVAFLRPVWRCE